MSGDNEWSRINRSLLDPPKWGWSALGGVVDVSEPHEHARRKEGMEKYFANVKHRKRTRYTAFDDTERIHSPTEGPRPHAETHGASTSHFRQHNGSNGSTRDYSNDGGGLSQSSSSAHAQGHNPLSTASADGNLRFHAVHNGKVTDIFTYHRGRQGEEVRNQVMGNLQADIPPTDTHHFSKQPMDPVVTVRIAIPIGDAGQLQHALMETVRWDLTDPKQPPPMVVASNLAEEYGLSRNQVWLLVESIQEQIDAHVRQHCSSYAEPLPMMNPMDGARDRGLPVVATLYGSSSGREGMKLEGIAASKSSKVSLSRRTSMSSSETKGGKALGKKTASRNLPEHRQEVRRRLQLASIEELVKKAQRRKEAIAVAAAASAVANEKSSGSNGASVSFAQSAALETSTEECHVCGVQGANCYQLPCGRKDHIFCRTHFEQKLRTPVACTSADNFRFCPICTLSCACPVCNRTLDRVATKLRMACDETNAPLERAYFTDDILRDTQTELMKTIERTKARRQSGKNSFLPSKKVPKVPVAEFPRQVVEGHELITGDEDLYRTVFDAEGSRLTDKTHADVASGEAGFAKPPPLARATTEDGSADHCQKCRGPGNLICCDFCPRAYHQKCLDVASAAAISRDPWKCPACTKEDVGLPSDHLNGSATTFDSAGIYGHLQSTGGSGAAVERLLVLRILDEMLSHLLKYDFGYLFAHPVDCELFPSYAKIVKNPMDIGTICKRLRNGTYLEEFDGESPPTLDEVIMSVLKDVELVWHNCFTFNSLGSAVYRMAQVQKRRVEAIRKKSLDALLSDGVKRDVAAYAAKLAEVRNKMERPGSDLPSPRRNRKIVLPDVRTSAVSIAVLDPDHGRVAKVYQTLGAACEAVLMLANGGFESEWSHLNISKDSHVKLRKIFKTSPGDPKLLIFGYRWLPLCDLVGNNVSFPKKAPPSKMGDPVKTNPPPATNQHAPPTLLPVVALPTSPMPSYMPIYKIDVASGATLDAFTSVDAAFADWATSMQLSKLAPDLLSNGVSRASFEHDFLNGSLSINGVCWKYAAAATAAANSTEAPPKNVDGGTTVVSNT